MRTPMKETQILISDVANGWIVNHVTTKECLTFIADTPQACVNIVKNILEENHETVKIPDSISHSSPGRIYLDSRGEPPKSPERR